MNNTIRNKIYSSTNYAKIYYQTEYSHGEIIVKDEILDIKSKFHRLFKDSDYEVIRNYRVTMLDIIKSALRYYHKQFYIYEYKKKCEEKRSYSNEHYMADIIIQLKRIHSIIVRLERKIGRYETY